MRNLPKSATQCASGVVCPRRSSLARKLLCSSEVATSARQSSKVFSTMKLYLIWAPKLTVLTNKHGRKHWVTPHRIPRTVIILRPWRTLVILPWIYWKCSVNLKVLSILSLELFFLSTCCNKCKSLMPFAAREKPIERFLKLLMAYDLV